MYLANAVNKASLHSNKKAVMMARLGRWGLQGNKQEGKYLLNSLLSQLYSSGITPESVHKGIIKHKGA